MSGDTEVVADVKYYSNDFAWESLLDIGAAIVARQEAEQQQADQSDTGKCSRLQSNSWDRFHKTHSSAKFFKERRYLVSAFPELLPPPAVRASTRARPPQSLLAHDNDIPAPSPNDQVPSPSTSMTGAVPNQQGTVSVPPSHVADELNPGPQPPLRVLEVGCGNGSTLVSLLRGNPDVLVWGCDISPSAVEHARIAARLLGRGCAARCHLFVWDPVVSCFPESVLREPPVEWGGTVGSGGINVDQRGLPCDGRCARGGQASTVCPCGRACGGMDAATGAAVHAADAVDAAVVVDRSCCGVASSGGRACGGTWRQPAEAAWDGNGVVARAGHGCDADVTKVNETVTTVTGVSDANGAVDKTDDEDYGEIDVAADVPASCHGGAGEYGGRYDAGRYRPAAGAASAHGVPGEHGGVKASGKVLGTVHPDICNAGNVTGGHNNGSGGLVGIAACPGDVTGADIAVVDADDGANHTDDVNNAGGVAPLKRGNGAGRSLYGGNSGGASFESEDGCQSACPEAGDAIAVFDIIMLVFTLSAVHPDDMPAFLASVTRVLKPGGRLLFRDYGLYDMSMLRFTGRHRLGASLYMRGDGTLSYFFTREKLQALMAPLGLETEQNEYCCVTSINRRKGSEMKRVWVQGKFRLMGARTD